MHDAILGLSSVKPDPAVPEHPELWILRGSVQMLCRNRIAALERGGRTEELQAMLRLAFRDDDCGTAAELLRQSLEHGCDAVRLLGQESSSRAVSQPHRRAAERRSRLSATALAAVPFSPSPGGQFLP